MPYSDRSISSNPKALLFKGEITSSMKITMAKSNCLLRMVPIKISAGLRICCRCHQLLFYLLQFIIPGIRIDQEV